MNNDSIFPEHFLTPLTILPGETPITKPKEESIQRSPMIYKESPVIYKEKKMPLFTNLYIGSLTVIGLLIVFRFIQKSR